MATAVFGSLLLVPLAHAQAEEEDAALIAEAPQGIRGVIPPSGATIPTNARVTFSMGFQSAVGIESTLEVDQTSTTLNSEELFCANACVGTFDLGVRRPGEALLLTLGTNLDLSETVDYVVEDVEDTAPPALGGEHIVTSAFDAFAGQLAGYTVEVNVPRASDNYGIAFYEVRIAGSAEELSEVTVLVFGEPASVVASTFLGTEVTNACAQVVAVDWVGHATSSAVICEVVTPPTDEELEATREAFSCAGGGPVGGAPTPDGSGPPPATLGLLVLGFSRLRRRRRPACV